MNEDFRDLFRAFSDAEVRFLIVGAYAVSAHAEPRATGDLDLWIEPTPENAVRLAAEYAGVPCHVIGRDALVANKRALGRTKDLADLELLERHGR